MSLVNWIIFAFGVFVTSLLSAGLFITVRYFKMSDRQAMATEGERRREMSRSATDVGHPRA